MFSDSDEKLTEIEKCMLDALDRAYEQWSNNYDQPLPMSLVQLMEKTHKTILARLGKRGGFNIAEMMKNPEEALVQLDKMRDMLIRMMAQREQNATVFQFPERPQA